MVVVVVLRFILGPATACRCVRVRACWWSSGSARDLLAAPTLVQVSRSCETQPFDHRERQYLVDQCESSMTCPNSRKVR